MEPPEQARRWQERFDRFFPDGCIIASAGKARGYSYPVPRPEVIGLRGLNPVVFLDFPSWDRNMLGTLTSWEPLKDTPCKVVRVVLDMGGGGQARDEAMLWSSNISPAQRDALAPDRRASLKVSADGRMFRRQEEE
jgi:hypothetical protein